VVVEVVGEEAGGRENELAALLLWSFDNFAIFYSIMN